jgi:hypothetical protein
MKPWKYPVHGGRYEIYGRNLSMQSEVKQEKGPDLMKQLKLLFKKIHPDFFMGFPDKQKVYIAKHQLIIRLIKPPFKISDIF